MYAKSAKIKGLINKWYESLDVDGDTKEHDWKEAPFVLLTIVKPSGKVH